MIDTHCHLGLCERPTAELVADARRVGVRRMLTVGIDEAGSERGDRDRRGATRRCSPASAATPTAPAGFDDAAAERIEELARPPAGRGGR